MTLWGRASEKSLAGCLAPPHRALHSAERLPGLVQFAARGQPPDAVLQMPATIQLLRQ
jgi:hypothetical protein